jgi:type VI secretion system protein
LSALARGAAPILAAMALQSCATLGPSCAASSGLKRLTIVAELDANGGLPVATDVVLVTSAEAFDAVKGLDARTYFAGRDQLRGDFPKDLKILSFEVSPGQQSVAELPDPSCDAVATLLFANYDNNAPNRLRLGPARAGRLRLAREGLSFTAE